MNTEDLRLKYLISELRRLKLIKNAEDLAKLVPVSKQTAAKWMRGEQRPNKKNMNILNTKIILHSNNDKPKVEIVEVKNNIFKRFINWVIKLFK